jgi:glutaredoxin
MEIWQKTLLAISAILIVGFIVWGATASDSEKVSSDDAGNPNASTVYYYGDGCPHCDDVQEFLNESGIGFGEDLAKKEVWNNSANQREMLARAESCGLDQSRIGVPFLWNDGKCFVGAPEVMEYFTSSETNE